MSGNGEPKKSEPKKSEPKKSEPKKKRPWQHKMTYERKIQTDRENKEVKDVFENVGNKYPDVIRLIIRSKGRKQWSAHAWIEHQPKPDMIITGDEEGNEHHSRRAAVRKLKEDLQKYAAGTYYDDE